MIELLPIIYRSGRYERQRSFRFYEEHSRGLPLIHVGSQDHPPLCVDPEGYEAPPTNHALSEVGHLARIDLSLITDLSTDWLDYPIMQRVDKLRIWPPNVTTDDWPALRNSFWEQYLPILAAHPLLDRLEELNPCGCEEPRITEMALRLLRPRVFVELDY